MIEDEAALLDQRWGEVAAQEQASSKKRISAIPCWRATGHSVLDAGCVEKRT